jgi:hypothetical protein
MANYQWGEANRVPQLQPFINHIGPTALVDVEDAWDVCRLLLSEELIQMLATETNMYVDQYIANKVLSPQCRARRWRNVTAEEMEMFLGLVILTQLGLSKSQCRDITGLQINCWQLHFSMIL